MQSPIVIDSKRDMEELTWEIDGSIVINLAVLNGNHNVKILDGSFDGDAVFIVSKSV